jgi:hypothetical protein
MTDTKPNLKPDPKTAKPSPKPAKPGKPRPRKAKAGPTTTTALPASASKLDRLAALLARPGGASIAEMMSAIEWQAHSVRGALAGALKRRGLTIASDKIDGIRRYRAGGKR